MTFINPKQKVFAHLDRLAAWQRGEKPAPVTLEWDLSNRCPWGCVDCHFAYTHTKGPWTRDARALPMAHDRGGDLADTALVLRVLEEAKAAGVQGIVWTGGGEPTTHPDYLYIFRRAHELGLRQGIYTLGATLREEATAWMRHAFEWAVISLDADNAKAYAAEKRSPSNGFAKACEAITRLSGSTCTVGVSYLLHERNWLRAVPYMLPLARSLGATYTTFRPTIRTSPDAPGTPVGDRAWVAEAWPWLVALAKEPDVEIDPQRFQQWAQWTAHPYTICYGIRLNATITPDGRMWVCPNRREYAGASCLGDLRTESFGAIWARHPGQWTDLAECRAMCRLNPVNETLAAVYQQPPHAAFV